jgi:hypothetical protein
MVNGLPNSRATAAVIVVAMSHPLSRCVPAPNNQILATSRGGVDTQIPQTHRDERLLAHTYSTRILSMK